MEWLNGMPTKCDLCEQEDYAMHITRDYGTICCDCMNKKRKEQEDERPNSRPIRPT